jgi:VanZ family protein
VRVPDRYRYALALGVALAVLAASVVDPPGSGGPTPLGPFGLLGADKYSHATAYLAVALSLGWARRAGTPRALLIVAAVATAYGAGIELVQAPLPARSFDLADAAANAVGAGIGTALQYLRTRE